MNLILLGPPGTGKGTIAKFIETRFKCVHVSTGDLLREEVAKETDFGKKIAPIMNEGKLIEDELVLKILEKLAKLRQNFVLDGFPRNLNQAELLDHLLEELGIGIDATLEIASDEDIIIRRLSARRQCVKCMRIYGLDVPSKVEGICDHCGSQIVVREDDRAEVVKKRLKIYKDVTEPLVAFYKKKKMLVKVDGNGTLSDIFKEVEKLLSKYEGK